MMGKNLDIMRELEDIGALGDKVPEVVVRRPAPVPVFSVVRDQPVLPAIVTTLRSDKLLAGFTEQLRTLEGALQGMLAWCIAAREQSQSLEATSSVEIEVPEATETVTEPKVETAPVEPPATISKPKFSKEELKRLFLDPTFVLPAPTNVEPTVTATTTPENS